MTDEQKLSEIESQTDYFQSTWKRNKASFFLYEYCLLNTFRKILRKRGLWEPRYKTQERKHIFTFSCPFCKSIPYQRKISEYSRQSIGPFIIDNLLNRFWCERCKVTGNGIDLYSFLTKKSKKDSFKSLTRDVHLYESVHEITMSWSCPFKYWIGGDYRGCHYWNT